MSQKMQRILIDGKEIEEGAVINKWFNQRFNANKNILVATVGGTGCLSGETIIVVSRNKGTRRYTIKHLFDSFNGKTSPNGNKFDLSLPTFIRSFNGEIIRLNRVKKVFYSGIKKVYSLTLENGLSIKSTEEHLFLTKENKWIELSKLKGREIMCDTLNAEPLKRKRIKLRDIGLNVGKNHPYNIQPNGQISVHNLIYEARMNGLEFTEYLDILLNESERCKILKYINPSTQTIHHKDGCHYNNSIENLELLPRQEHYFKHNSYTNFSQGVPKFSKVIDIKLVGDEETYDIECEEPYHNFVANGIVVHNSGKTYSNIRMCELWYKYKFDEPFPQENICFSVSEAVKRLRGGLRKGEFIIVEEAGVLINSLDFQNKIAKFFTGVLQSFRSKNIGVVFNLPNISFLNKTARTLLHVVFQTQRIDPIRKEVVVKPFYWQTNSLSGKTYQKYLQQKINGHHLKIQRLNFGLPSSEILIPYEKRKDEFVNKTMDNLIELQVENDVKIKDKNKPKEIQVAIKKIYDSGITKHEEIAKVLGVHRVAVTKHLALMEENGLISHNYLEKSNNFVTRNIPLPLST